MEPTAPQTDDCTFVPENLDPSDFDQIESLLQALYDRDLPDVDALMHWLADMAELEAVVHEYGTRLHIATSCHTDDSESERHWLHYVNEIQPKYQPWVFRLQQKLVACPHRKALPAARWANLNRCWQTDVDIFRQANVPIKAELRNLDNEVGKINGAMTVTFRGKPYTLQQMALFLEDHDRPTRREAWTLQTDRRLEDRDSLDDLFDRMFERRARLAANADLDNYRDYIWKSRHRYFYGTEDCLSFGRTVEQVCMPIVRQIDEQRREALGVDSLRPWDSDVDVDGRSPLRPFDPQNIADLLEKTNAAFCATHPQLGQWFAQLQPGRNLDLATRPHKRPGGFQASLEKVRECFIFMNAAGTQRDLITLLHEAGHAFHYLAASTEPCVFLRHAALEFCEVAAMSMELIGLDHYDMFYPDPADARRAKREQLERIIRLLPWVATIDGFQHQLYTHGDHSRDQRTAAWLELRNRFGSPVVDWTGLEEKHEAMWQRQPHLFNVPFYYIEYGIAQLGALGVWNNYRRDPEQALSMLIAAFEAGGKQTLPELFETAGLNFDFSEKTIRPLVEMVWKQWNELAD